MGLVIKYERSYGKQDRNYDMCTIVGYKDTAIIY